MIRRTVPELLVGGPILFRAWSVPAYMSHVHAACRRAEVEPEFVFAGDPARDPETWDAIDAHAKAPVHQVVVAEPTRTEDKRDWATPGRFARMAEIRNALMAEVRTLAPRWFLSLDSDILLHPDALVNMLESLDRFDAVGGKCYMSIGRSCPSYGMLVYPYGGLHRPDFAGVAKVDVVMAVVLQSPQVFGVPYGEHRQGEDLYWSIEAKKAGLRLGWDGRACNKHLMVPADLDRIDERVGF
jgi:hypothetical protein